MQGPAGRARRQMSSNTTSENQTLSGEKPTATAQHPAHTHFWPNSVGTEKLMTISVSYGSTSK